MKRRTTLVLWVPNWFWVPSQQRMMFLGMGFSFSHSLSLSLSLDLTHTCSLSSGCESGGGGAGAMLVTLSTEGCAGVGLRAGLPAVGSRRGERGGVRFGARPI